MQLRNDFKALYSEIERQAKRDQHHIVNEAKFSTLKQEILEVIKNKFGESSRHYRVVKLTNSPATILKVMNHTAANRVNVTSLNTAVNM